MECPGIDDDKIANITRCPKSEDAFFCTEGVNLFCESDECNGINDCSYGEDEMDCRKF